jgi:CTP:molybdopterin cytidylyltransferase MocA
VQNKTNKSEKTLGALVLAAGLSSRMGEFKPLLEINGKTLLEHAVALFEVVGIEQIVTVVGHRAEDLVRILATTSSRHIVNENYQDGMFSSVQKGVEALQNTCDAIFLLPADIAFVRPATIQKLWDEYFKAPSPLIFYPQFQARRGHPPLLDSSLFNNILSYNGDAGMRGLLRQFQNQAVNVAVNDPFIHMDIDTPEDLFHIRHEMRNYLS